MSREVGNRLILLIDILSLGIGIYGLLGVVKNELPPYLASGGHWQFLTNISLVISLLVFFLGIAAHATKNEKAFTLKNKVHQVATSLEFVVTLVYWPLRLFLLHLLIKDPSKKIISLPVDLAVHLIPLTSLLVDYLVFMPKWTIKREIAFLISMCLSVLYYVYLNILIDFENGGSYPYAFLEVESEVLRFVIVLAVGSIGFLSTVIVDNLYELVIGKPRENLHEYEKKVA